MAAQSEPRTRTLGEGLSESRLVPASSPELNTAKDATNARSAKGKVDGGRMEQFIHNLLCALSAWST